LKFDNYDYIVYIFVFCLLMDRSGLMLKSLEQKLNFGLSYNFFFAINIFCMCILIFLMIKIYKKAKMELSCIPEE